MKVTWLSILLLFGGCIAAGPFLTQVDDSTWVLGNDLWNITQGAVYGTKLYYKDQDLVGEAVGHYAGYTADVETELTYTSAEIESQGSNFIDIRFESQAGDFHWVIFDDLVGAYQYYVARSLPVLGIFRSLVRLDNQTFPNGRTYLKNEKLPAFAEILNATNVQDETWERADGTFITKYDWTTFTRPIDFYGVYGHSFGSWYIRPGGDYLNGDQLKQELMVHRESSTGDAVQLNVVHGTHFMASSSDAIPDGKVFGPWLWYLNDGSIEDADARHAAEFEAWPYAWFNDSAYQARASVAGTIVLSDGRPAAAASVFLGDNHPNETSLDQGRYFYYNTFADESGNFNFSNVRAGTYGLQAWGNGGILSNVTTVLLENDVDISASSDTVDLGSFTWTVPSDRTTVFQIGALDRKAEGFVNGGAPYQHALVASSLANLTFVIGDSDESTDWYFGQSSIGSWDVQFNLPSIEDRDALLSVSLAGYSKGASGSIYVNRDIWGNGTASKVGNLTNGIIPSDPSVYRSATLAGEWHLFEFPVNTSLLQEGRNTVSFAVEQYTEWRGWIWDSVLFQWV